MVELFIKHICGWESNENGRGVFGKPSAYFGTVEQQGRMTLHLHFLLWIDGAPSPQEIRDKLLSGDSKFEEQLIAYMESCQVGEFQTGTMEELKARIPKFNRKKDKGIHTLFDPEEDIDMCEIPENYIDPTLTLPEAPPHTWCERNDNCQCPSCIDLEMWYERFKGTFDDIVFRSNVHKCFGRKDNADSAIANKSTPRQHLTGKGCINKHGVCTARFPRTLFDATEVDRKTGHISLKKHEPMINNVTPTVSYAFRCNTDTTCLGSGTAVNSTAGYVTDYITKGTLKTHQIFSAMYNVFSNNSDVLSDDSQQLNGARKMILKVVNSLSAKMEIGAPMAALYLLQNPDYYTSHEFQPFYWKNFVNYVNNQWENLRDNAQPQDVDNNTRSPVGIDIVPPDAPEGTAADRYGAGDETVRMGRSGNNFISKASTDDYRYRPIEHEKINLYEWIQCSLRHHEEHPMSDSHLVACDPERRYYVVPNFLGPALPRKDKGDREDYCMAMMTLFAPWRSGLDLKGSECTWQEAFDAHAFTTRQLQLMKNFNVRYECYDARDDFSAAFKKISAGEQSVVLSDDEEGNLAQVKNDAYEWITVMDDIVKEYSLNTGQERAFRIVANHATCIAPEQLLMHLGGMGGTGKSQVIKALVAFFERRKEPYRFVLLAPTGTAAALIGGTTYHSFLGFQTGRVGNNDSMLSTSDVIERMKGVGYVLMDEISMAFMTNLTGG
ncbi:hypothetical protein EST38_g7115 [Candolleomyces aberdarensis]|uniref:ATP-dependent DNA helicase n=1 Tax=Candolleomyces aberdarensis TaxID=2316362 RepID=A0A4Q2DGF7_9AGAR|nr:hypothetical protein EST38_g7115 [Candolleomyces aberdarensis]